MSFSNIRYPIAQKVHLCDWCGKCIDIGEKYYYYAGTCHGEFSTLKYHLICEKVIDGVLVSEGMSSYELSELQDIYHDCYEQRGSE